MIFNSLEFFVFLAVVLSLYAISRHKTQNLLLLIASYVFYGWWDVRFLFLIALSTCVDYCCGILMHHGRMAREEIVKVLLFLSFSVVGFLVFGDALLADSATGPGVYGLVVTAGSASVLVVAGIILFFNATAARLNDSTRRRWLIIVSVLTNLGILGFFKYCNFFVESASDVLTAFGMSDASTRTLAILLPVGISFYTFQTMSYTIDIYRRKMLPTRDLLDFSLFVAYFPQLVAGPIERAAHLLPRLSNPRVVTSSGLTSGLGLIAYGLFKKVVIADGVAGSVDIVYGAAGSVSGFDVFCATLLFAVQIYCDFSGYTDIARGTSRLLGIDLMRNFNLPYFSKSPSEFWQRWHISLSSWLRDYLYVSLGGNRKGTLVTYRNLMLTMLLGGLWHGAAWNFVLWGGYHGLLLCIYRACSGLIHRLTPSGKAMQVAGSGLAIFVFFAFTLYGWLLFRAESFEQVMHFSQALFSISNFTVGSIVERPPISALFGVLILIGYELKFYAHEKGWELNGPVLLARPLLYGFMLFVFVASLSTPPAQFIYFQF